VERLEFVSVENNFLARLTVVGISVGCRADLAGHPAIDLRTSHREDLGELARVGFLETIKAPLAYEFLER